MPTTSTRYNRPSSPEEAESSATPLRSRLSTMLRTGSTSSPTITHGGQTQKINVVTRVAIIGEAEKEEDNGANIRMYLKISLPLENIAPGSIIPLFAEENVKVLDSQVHPLDKNSVPYDFSPDLSPLLLDAVTALDLKQPAQNFQAVYGLSPPGSNGSVMGSLRSPKLDGASSSRKIPPPPIDMKYTGQIIVSGYSIAYVAPTIFPTRLLLHDDHPRSSSSRRSSSAERHANFMGAIDMWVPLMAQPPRSPYLLSIPTPPQCLNNSIRLALFSPPPQSGSTASLSSTDSGDQYAGCWDLTSDPPVTRKTSRRPSIYNRQDDNLSDSSESVFDVNGAFPTTDRVRIRWAKRQIEVGSEDARRRVGVSEVKGEMTVAVLGKKWSEEHQKEGIVMELDYKGSCKNVFFPGVATMLGMDVSLTAKGSDVAWLPDQEAGWTVGGGTGYTGFDVGAPPKVAGTSRHDSFDSNAPFLSADRSISRQSSASSQASLLRGSLPVNNVPEYSFEGTPSSQGTSLESSMASSSVPSATESSVLLRPPGVPITIHVDMNKILPSTREAKNSFSFSIKGTVLVIPKARKVETDSVDPESVVFPYFSVLVSNSESVTKLVRNTIDSSSSTVEVTYADSSSKTVLQRSDYLKCKDQARISVRSSAVFASSNSAATTPNGSTANINGRPPSRPRTPNPGSRERVSSGTRAMAVLGMAPAATRPKRDGALMIPSLRADVTLLKPTESGSRYPSSYSVRVTLAAPADAESDWLEFGLAKEGSGSDLSPPKVEIVTVSVDDVPVMHETRAATAETKEESGSAGLGVPFGQVGQEWMSWVRMRVGATGGGRVVVDYRVKDIHGADPKGKGKMKARDRTRFEVYLPSFNLPVGRLEVNLDGVPELRITNLRSNFSHAQTTPSGQKFLHYSLPPFFYPHISLNLSPDRGLQNQLFLGFILLLMNLGLVALAIHIEHRSHPPFFPHNAAGLAVDSGGYPTLDSPQVHEPITITVTVSATVYQPTGCWPWQQLPTSASSGEDLNTPLPESTPHNTISETPPSIADTQSPDPPPRPVLPRRHLHTQIRTNNGALPPVTRIHLDVAPAAGNRHPVAEGEGLDWRPNCYL
ncbi:hypothetical protein MIND_01090400 [Mycena indigotica]|uniref:Uncharacterized protein n=1 Tax=Mycena indigotica TaxID=2126181 RepID=A0A8H6S9J8_9AGAR|nr:uncharacterized protein MIND_01090400 [Mycena indigotica]KAF7295505.1 hypothetical protein MIND_01090400 [Mycena indigotica]